MTEPSGYEIQRGKRTLVVHTGAIGDFLLACPAIAALAEDGPVELAGRPERIALAVAGGIAVRAHDLETLDFHTLFLAPSPRLRAFLAGFDRAVVWMRDSGALETAIRACGVAEVLVFPGLPPEGCATHASQYYLDCLHRRGAPWRLRIAPAETQCDIVIHPGSGSKRKNWPLDRFAEVARILTSRGRRITWCRGPAEDFPLPVEPHDLLETTSLVELAGRLAASRLYIGNDSGITHLAAAVSCPTVAIFGPTDPRVWGPLGAHVHAVQSEPWPEIAQIMAAIDSII